MVAEFGSSWRGDTTASEFTEDLHDGLWTVAMTRAGGAPMFWWHQFIDQHNLYSELRSLSRFLKSQDPRGLPLKMRHLKGFENENEALWIECLAFSGVDQGRAWILDVRTDSCDRILGGANYSRNIKVKIPGLMVGKYRVDFWDTRKGRLIKREEVRAGPNSQLNLECPPFDRDIALKFILLVPSVGDIRN